jgi:hypothetical protein
MVLVLGVYLNVALKQILLLLIANTFHVTRQANLRSASKSCCPERTSNDIFEKRKIICITIQNLRV